MALYHKYRPKTFEAMVGNKETISALSKLVADSVKRPHAYLLTGPTGTGKTTLARIMAKSFGCASSCFHEINASDFRGIDTIRELRNQAIYKPLEGESSVWLLDEVHAMTSAAQNAMLKILEDAPAHAYYILATTEPQMLLDTVKGRCVRFELNLLSDTFMTTLLNRVCKKEGQVISEEIMEQIVQDAQGHPRNALTILEKVLSVSEEERLKVAKETANSQSQSIQLCRQLLDGSPWKKISNTLKDMSDKDVEKVRREVLGYMNSVLLKSQNDRAAYIIEAFSEPFYNTGRAGLTFASYDVVKNGA